MAVLITIAKILVAILVFGVIILVHELGHFLMARLMKVKVNEFAIGMGPQLLKFGKKETVYSLRAFPVGGFCAMEGEDAAGGGEIKVESEGNAGRETQDGASDDACGGAAVGAADTPATPAGKTAADGVSTDPRAFCNKKVWRRVLIVVAGAVMNLLLGLVLLIVYFAVFTQPRAGESKAQYSSTMVAQFFDDAASAESGLRAGDRILKIDGKRVISAWDLGVLMGSVPIQETTTTEGAKRYMATIDMTVRRTVDGKAQTVQLNDVRFNATGPTSLTVDFYVKGIEKTVWSTLEQSAKMEVSVGILIWRSLGDMLTGKYGLNQLSGPVGVVDAIGDAALPSTPSGGFTVDWETLLMMTVMITVNVGIFNLLPLPALDGGRLVFLLFEGITRRKVPAKWEGLVHAIGLILLLLLMVVVTFSDVWRILQR